MNHAESVRFLQTLGMLPKEEAEELPENEAPDFDGGARETPPLPSDPEADMNSLIVDLAAAKRVSRGPHGWGVD